jgi:asparagine synthetase B (glutamine-hydrolysing)
MEGFLIACGELDSLRHELGRSRIGEALLKAMAPVQLAGDKWVLSASLETETLPFLMTAAHFSGICLSGRVYSEWGTPGRDTATSMVLDAYRHFGRHAQARLNGEYCFCLFDADAATLHASVDLFGVRSLYYLEHRGLWALSDRCSALLALFDNALKLNGPAIAGFLVPFAQQCMDRGETFYDGLRVLRAGEWLSIDLTKGQSHRTRIGLPQHLIESDPLSTSRVLQDLSEALLEALRDRKTGNRVSMTLSGGIDSAVLATQLSRLRYQFPDLELCALTSVLRGPAGESEARYAELTASASGITLRRVMRDPGALPFPVASPVPWAEQPLAMYDNLAQLRRLIALGGAPALSGLGADEVVATSFRRPGLRRSVIPRLWRRLARPKPAVQSTRDVAFVQDLRLLLQSHPPDWIVEHWHEGLPMPDLDGQPSAGERRTWYDLLLPNSGFCCDIEGVDDEGIVRADRSLPFLDHRVVKVLLNPAAAQLDLDRAPSKPGKQVLRRLLRGMVPDAVAKRSKHPAGQPIFERFAGPEVAGLSAVLDRIPRLGDYFRPWQLPGPDVDRPWSTLYPLIAGVSVGSWLLHISGVEAQWTTTAAKR